MLIQSDKLNSLHVTCLLLKQNQNLMDFIEKHVEQNTFRCYVI
jgi:hypothetical protein